MTYSQLELNGKVAVVVGGTSGIGRAIAHGFAQAGADVIPTSRRAEQVESAAREIEQLGRRSLRVTSDVADRASSETDWSIELRTRDRQRKLIAKIDAAIRRLYDGEYGYCEVTGDPISLGRLEARPIATMTLEAQEKHERIERVSRDD